MGPGPDDVIQNALNLSQLWNPKPTPLASWLRQMQRWTRTAIGENLVEWGISIAVMPRPAGSTLSLAGSGRCSIVTVTPVNYETLNLPHHSQRSSNSKLLNFVKSKLQDFPYFRGFEQLYSGWWVMAKYELRHDRGFCSKGFKTNSCCKIPLIVCHRLHVEINTIQIHPLKIS